jgi:hypothetical protein
MSLALGVNLANQVPESLRRKLYGFLIQGDKERFTYFAALAGGIALSSSALLKHKGFTDKVKSSVAQGRMDAMMGKYLISGSRKSIISGAIIGSIAGAITGRVFFKKFHKDVTDPLRFVAED